MIVSEIREALRAQPFRPFTIHLADGRAFSIQHVDFLLIHPNDRTIIAAGLDGGHEIIDPVLVTSLSVANGAAETAD